MRVTSVFGDGEAIPAEHTCDGEDILPPLNIMDVPEGTESLAMIMDDPDAESKDVFCHFLIWNIPPNMKHIEAGLIPDEATIGLNDFEKKSYGGPCPIAGTHKYFFKVYALDTKLDLDAMSRKVDLEEAMDGHIIEEAMLMGTYTKMEEDNSDVEEIDEDFDEDEEEE